jgi:hypothetical protein
MRQHRADTASTRNVQANIVAARAEVDRMFPAHVACTMQDVFCFATLADANAGTMYSDLTGAFPIQSFKNMQYVFVAYVYDLNTIIVCAMPTWTDASMITAFIEVIHGGQDDLILSAIQAKWPPKLGHQRNSCQILQNCATESRWACSKTLIKNSHIRGFFYTDFFM